MFDPGVLILMAAFNGERFIAEQIESIRQQTLSRWRLIVRDDGSSDNTRNIVRGFSRMDHRVRLVEDDPGRLGPAGNFNRLMELSCHEPEPYIAFADQDDLWEVDKLNLQVQDMRRMEERYGVDRPLLIHSDLKIVDENSVPVHRSFARFQHIPHPETQDLHTLLIQNVAVGNTILINRPLLDLAVPIPDAAHMHDWWLALCAAAFGALAYNPRQLVAYRIHSQNVTCPVGFRRACTMKDLFPERLRKMNRIFVASLRQADALRERVARLSNTFSRMHPLEHKVKAIDDYLAILQLPAYRRPAHLLKTKIRRQMPLLTILLLIQALSDDLLKKAAEGMRSLKISA